MNKDLLLEYATLCKTLKEMEARKDTLAPMVLEHLNSVGNNTLSTEFGTFTVMTRKSWEYSDAIKEREKTIAEAKKVEQEVGAAKCKEVQYVRYQ